MKMLGRVFGPLLFFVAAPALAQRVGLTVGKTNSDIVNLGPSGRPSSSYPDRHAYTFGITYRQRLTSWAVLQPELLRLYRGWAEQNHPTLSLTYVEIPILLRLGAVSSEGSPLKPTFTLGAAASILQSCSLTNLDLARAEGTGCDQRIVSPFTEDYRIRPTDLGVVFGVGAETRVHGGSVVGVEGRFEFGLNDIRRDAQNSHNSTLFILVNVVPRLF